MQASTTLKTLTMLGATSLALMAGTVQADPGYPYYGGNPYANPWLNNQPAPPPNHVAEFRDRQAQFDTRMDNQMQRILDGMESGKLTLREATALLREHVAISSQERRYLADGRLGPNELGDLERRLDNASRAIQFEKNDWEQRPANDRPDYWRR